MNIPTEVVKNVRLTRKADRWFVSFRIDVDKTSPTKSREVVGVDLGFKSLATCSDGTVFPNVKAYRRLNRKLTHLQRSLCRKQKGSSNRRKVQIAIARLHFRISCIRKDATHKLTSWITKNHGTVVIEDLNVSQMLRNHRLANAIADSGLYECRRQLEYKSELYGTQLIIADRWYPSSQLCSDCGHQQKMPLKERTFNCEKCCVSKDRDANAALNLEALARSSSVNACGESHKLAA